MSHDAAGDHDGSAVLPAVPDPGRPYPLATLAEDAQDTVIKGAFAMAKLAAIAAVEEAREQCRRNVLAALAQFERDLDASKRTLLDQLTPGTVEHKVMIKQLVEVERGRRGGTRPTAARGRADRRTVPTTPGGRGVGA